MVEFYIQRGNYIGKMFSKHIAGDKITYNYKIYSIKDKRKAIARSYVDLFSRDLCLERMEDDLEIFNMNDFE